MRATLVEALDAAERTDRGLHFVDRGLEEERVASYGEVGQRARDVARRLLGLGLEKGDRVIMVVPSQADFVELFLGAVRGGIVPVPVFPPFMLNTLDAYMTGIARIARITGARALVTSAEVAPLLAQARGLPRLLTNADVAAAEPATRLPAVGPEDLAFLQFTSGSTADPRGVEVTHATLMANATAIGRHFRIHADDRGVSWLPLYHDMGLIGFVVVPLIVQGSTWYMAPLEFVRKPTAWCDLLSRVGGTIAFAPNFGYGLVERRATDEQVAGWDLSRWRIAGCGAEPIDARTLRAFARRLAPAGFADDALLPAYGMAEATLAISLSPLTEPPRYVALDREALVTDGRAEPPREGRQSVELVSCGPVIPGHELRILDADGRELGAGHEGEIAFRGASATARYFRDPDASAEVYRDGWVRTGDLGLIDRGELLVTGRVKDVVIVAGRKYHAHDLEWCASEEPGVRRGNVVAFSCPGPDGDGERVVVLAEPRADAAPGELARRIRARIRASLGVGCEAVVVARDSIPKTTSGKLRRRHARQLFLDGGLVHEA